MNHTFQSNNQTIITLQSFGSLVILDRHFNVVGITESVVNDHDAKENLLGTHFFDSFSNTFGESLSKIKNAVTDLHENRQSRHILPIKMRKERVYVKLRRHDEYFYIEWEQQHKKYIAAKKINELNFLLDTIQPNNWDRVCSAVNKLLNYDRVFVLQVQETVIINSRPDQFLRQYSRIFVPRY